jgi:hypothetical protein
MSLLDPAPEPYKFPVSRFKRYKKGFEGENQEALNNEGHEEVTEDFEDSPFADRQKEHELE